MRDEAMERMNERQFGFKLFIRVFVLAVTYHARRAITAKGLSFASYCAIEGSCRPSRATDRYTNELWSTTADAVVAIRRVLRDSLKLDAIRFLPGHDVAASVVPVPDQVPGLMEGNGTEGVAVKR